MPNAEPKPILVRPVWTNVGVRTWYYDVLDALLKEAAADISERIRSAWDESPPTIGFAQDAVGNLDKALAAWGRKWALRFERMSDDIATRFAAKSQRATEYSMRTILKQAGFTVAFKPTRKSVEAYKAVAAENVGLIRSIAQKYHTDVQEKVWNAVRVGNDLSKLSIDLRKSYGISVRRAALIARDQSNKARAVMEATRRQELGITQAVWRHSSAGKTPRPTHVAMAGKRYDLARGMYDSEVKEFVHPGQLISCRCSSSAIIPGIHT